MEIAQLILASLALTDATLRATNHPMIVRDENSNDVSAVRQVVAAAFDQVAEADLVDALRGSGEDVISLVAEEAGEIVGHVMFSKLKTPDLCVSLAPLSVAPSHQGQGVGSNLVRQGLARAISDGWQAVFVLGAPKYYGRFGFDTVTAAKFETEYPKAYFMALELTPNALSQRAGAVIHAPPFLELE